MVFIPNPPGATIATPADVAARVGRPLTAFETTRVQAFLDDVEVEIQRLAADRLTDPQWVAAVKSVECSVVIRAARLPDSLSTVVPATEGAGFASAPAVQGAVYLRREERRRLGLPLTGAVSMAPKPTVYVDPNGGGWYPSDSNGLYDDCDRSW